MQAGKWGIFSWSTEITVYFASGIKILSFSASVGFPIAYKRKSSSCLWHSTDWLWSKLAFQEYPISEYSVPHRHCFVQVPLILKFKDQCDEIMKDVWEEGRPCWEPPFHKSVWDGLLSWMLCIGIGRCCGWMDYLPMRALDRGKTATSSINSPEDF